jgi:hypothetical protein
MVAASSGSFPRRQALEAPGTVIIRFRPACRASSKNARRQAVKRPNDGVPKKYGVSVGTTCRGKLVARAAANLLGHLADRRQAVGGRGSGSVSTALIDE